jgi:hypothetical protein
MFSYCLANICAVSEAVEKSSFMGRRRSFSILHIIQEPSFLTADCTRISGQVMEVKGSGGNARQIPCISSSGKDTSPRGTGRG